MNQDTPLSNLLDQVYELEGLIHIALNRENPPQVLASLIEKKVQAITSLTPEAVAYIPVGEDVASYSKEEEPVESEVSPVEFADEQLEETIPMETLSPDYDLPEEYSGTADFATAISEEVAAPAILPSSGKETGKGKGRPALSLNDRYRFRRTLFNGNDTEYQGALSVAGSFDTYKEAEAYFYGTLGWNSEDDEVKAFMELLENWYRR